MQQWWVGRDALWWHFVKLISPHVGLRFKGQRLPYTSSIFRISISCCLEDDIIMISGSYFSRINQVLPEHVGESLHVCDVIMNAWRHQMHVDRLCMMHVSPWHDYVARLVSSRATPIDFLYTCTLPLIIMFDRSTRKQCMFCNWHELINSSKLQHGAVN